MGPGKRARQREPYAELREPDRDTNPKLNIPIAHRPMTLHEPLFAALGRMSWASWASTGRILGPPGRRLGASWAHLGATWAHPGHPGRRLGTQGAPYGHILGILGAAWAPKGHSSSRKRTAQGNEATFWVPRCTAHAPQRDLKRKMQFRVDETAIRRPSAEEAFGQNGPGE